KLLGEIGSLSISKLALNGELLALLSADTLALYDIDLNSNGSLSLRSKGAVSGHLGHFNRISQLQFGGQLLEWRTNRLQYANSELPLANIWALQPQRIANEQESLSLKVNGSAGIWTDVVVDVYANSTGQLMPGYTQALGETLEFSLNNAVFELGEIYHLSLFNPPAQIIDGGEVNFDLPWSVDTHALFGLSPLSVQQIQPANTITGRATQYVVSGQQLQLAEHVSLGGVTLDSSQWQVNEQGSQLTFTSTIHAPGLFNLLISQTGQEDVLPAAVLVAEALSINTISSNNSAGNTRISDSGGDEITVAGGGFVGTIEVHLLEDAPGFNPNSQNKVDHWIDSQGIHFITDNAKPDHNYRVVLIRQATAEVLYGTTVLLGIDDTRPVVTGRRDLGYVQAIEISLNEKLQASGFTVIKTFKDYSTTAPEDISSRFELVIIGQTLVLRLIPGQQLDHNASYQSTISGISDLANNIVVNSSGITNGIYRGSFTAKDLLAPVSLVLSRKSDSQTVTSGMKLTRGRTYTFKGVAEDNYQSASSLTYDLRVSTNGGLDFGPYQRLSSNGLSLGIQESWGNLAFVLKAVDNYGNFATQRFDVSVVNPNINVSAVYTTPIKVEELSRADIHFELSGDADLVTSVEVMVQGRAYGADFALTQDNLSDSLGHVIHSYLNPKLSDIAPSDRISVSLKVNYGFSGIKVVDDSYQLFLDATPPTVTIVSPQNGDRIALDDNTDVLIQSFDRFGVSKVEISENGGPFIELLVSNRHKIRAETTEPFTIQARAVDPNGNVGLSPINTVQPFDASLGEPKLVFINPQNGVTFNEGQTVSFEILMQNLTSATLYLEVGGASDDPRNPEPLLITRTEEQPKRFFVTTDIPLTGENVVVLARMAVDEFNPKVFMNVLKDEGIDHEPSVELSPENRVLGGTGVWLAGQKPHDMSDYADDSNIVIVDGMNTDNESTQTLPMDVNQLVPVNSLGDKVSVDAVLRDLSKHQKNKLTELTKLAYLTDTNQLVYSAAGSEFEITKVVSISGMKNDFSNGDLAYVLNDNNGGYSIELGDRTLDTQPQGEISQLLFTGTGLAAE
ncbi:MAG: Ig-like domain-containing protein, partial [Psychrosphaera sp.]|nr:Ig-like domain-containing protein [Psychrosphaera sp.]